MPSELDPAYGNYLPPSQFNETPTEGMKRIEAEMQERPNTQRGRLAAGAGRSLEGYNARIGAQGPVGGGVMVAADPVTGQPVMVAGQAQAGPLSYQYSKPTFRGAPASQQIGVGGQPFDADAYFGVTAQQSPGQGRTYGANISQSGEDGGWSAYGGYNPTNRSANIGGSYQTNFAKGGEVDPAGGPANVSPAQREAGNFKKKHESVNGVQVAIENPKGSTRIRADSGASKMAADYGQILREHGPDHDHMNTDTFVGPHKNSDKVFVVNQQHPHTGKFNEHKVLLGYKDRAHALRDYAHSFSDGLGHKRIQSVVEMNTSQLKDWLKKANHTAPLKKADGGEVKATFADGGPVDLPEQVSTVAHDMARIAHKDKLDQRHLAYLLRAASGSLMPPDRAMEFAGQIMTGDSAGLMQRFQTYVPSARTFARLNEMLGGKHEFMGKGHMGKEMQRMKGVDALQRTKDALDAAMDSDVVRDRPAMRKALKRLSKRI